MPDFNRYAAYIAPPAGPLADFAASWLGWDPVQGVTVAHPDIDGLPRPIAEITSTPSKYGFHGTIKPPFRLAHGTSQDQLISDLESMTGAFSPITLGRLELTQMGRFLALTIAGNQTSLADLAAEIVQGLDHHRKPPSLAELGLRRANNLTSRQEALLNKWGYPYVLDQFKFHMTLTGKMPKSDAKKVLERLHPALAPLLPDTFTVSELCLFGEAESGDFHLIRRFPLTGGLVRPLGSAHKV